MFLKFEVKCFFWSLNILICSHFNELISEMCPFSLPEFNYPASRHLLNQEVFKQVFALIRHLGHNRPGPGQVVACDKMGVLGHNLDRHNPDRDVTLTGHNPVRT